jgi:flagellin-specific chaperone FliS
MKSEPLNLMEVKLMNRIILLISIIAAFTIWTGCSEEQTTPTELNDINFNVLDDPNPSEDAYSDIEARIAELEAYLATNPNEEAAALLESAQAALDAAKAAEADGDTRTAKRYLQQALGLLRQAYAEAHAVENLNNAISKLQANIDSLTAALGENPDAKVVEALAKAQDLLNQAKTALEAGDDESASRLIRQVGEVIKNLHVNAVAHDRIAQSIANLNAKIDELLAQTEDENAIAALNEAKELLAQAQAALDEGNTREAARLLAHAQKIVQRLVQANNINQNLPGKIQELRDKIAALEAQMGEEANERLINALNKAKEELANAEQALAEGNTRAAAAHFAAAAKLVSSVNSVVNKDEILAQKITRIREFITQLEEKGDNPELVQKLNDLLAQAEQALAEGDTQKAERIINEIFKLMQRLSDKNQERPDRGNGDQNPGRGGN